MFISNIQIKNFKTFKDEKIDLNDFNVLIGACASGKTNFVEILEFLKDVSVNFHNAIKRHDGIYLKNFNLLDENDESHLKVTFEKDNSDYSVELNGSIGLENQITISVDSLDYEIYFKFAQNGCEVINEHVALNCKILKEDQSFENIIHINNDSGKVKARFDHDLEFLKITDIIPNNICDIVANNFKKENIPIINSPLSSIPINWGGVFNNISSYDFDSKFLKNLNVIEDEVSLTKYGANLPIVLNSILNNDEERERFILFLNQFLPYVKDVNVEKILDEEKIFMILEKYNDVKIPAPFISDGTSTIIALIIATYFQENRIIVIEEPERHIHPTLISKLILMFKSVSNKQVIITTHNSEVLKHVNLDDILFISRNNKGFSDIYNLSENDSLKPFIEELGIDYVFVNDYLGLEL